MDKTTPASYRWIIIAALLLGVSTLIAGCMLAPIRRTTHQGMMGDGMMGGGMMGGGGMMNQDIPPSPVVEALPTATSGGTATVSYRADIQPIFAENCAECHGGLGGLWLDSYEYLMAGGNNGPVIVPGDPYRSALYLRITGEQQPAMPFGLAPLAARDVDLIREWIVSGAPNN